MLEQTVIYQRDRAGSFFVLNGARYELFALGAQNGNTAETRCALPLAASGFSDTMPRTIYVKRYTPDAEGNIAEQRLFTDPHEALKHEAAMVNQAYGTDRARVIVHDGEPRLLLAAVEGKRFSDMLEQFPHCGLALLASAFKALAELHKRNVVHRDIHNGNMHFVQLRDGTFECAFIDFGSADDLSSMNEIERNEMKQLDLAALYSMTSFLSKDIQSALAENVSAGSQLTNIVDKLSNPDLAYWEAVITDQDIADFLGDYNKRKGPARRLNMKAQNSPFVTKVLEQYRALRDGGNGTVFCWQLMKEMDKTHIEEASASGLAYRDLISQSVRRAKASFGKAELSVRVAYDPRCSNSPSTMGPHPLGNHKPLSFLK